MIYKNLYKHLNFKNNGFNSLIKNDIELYVSYNFVNRNDLLIDFALNSYVFDKELDCTGISSFLMMNNSIKNDLFLLFLLYSLSSCSDKKLSNFIIEKIHPKYYKLIDNTKISTLCNFHQYFTALGQILADEIINKEIMFDKLEYKFAMNYSSIFDTIALDGRDNYFILNIIFECLNELKAKGINISENIQNVLWYIPVLFNSSSCDMTNNDLKFANIFSSLCTAQQRGDVRNKVYDNRLKSFF